VKAALFDIDGTLTGGADFWGVLIHAPDVTSTQRTLLYATTLPKYALVKTGLVDQARFRSRWVHDMAGLMRGWREERANAICNEIVETRLVPDLRPGVVEVLRQHKAAGHLVLLVSTMFEPIVQGLASYLGADVGLGTQIEMHEGRCMGRVVGETCAGAQKVAAVQRYFAAHPPAVDLQDCAAYADSQSDVPLLAAVGHPTAVYPDPAMRQVAQERGWSIHELA